MFLHQLLCRLVDLGTKGGDNSSIPHILIKGVITVPFTATMTVLLPLALLINLPINAVFDALDQEDASKNSGSVNQGEDVNNQARVDQDAGAKDGITNQGKPPLTPAEAAVQPDPPINNSTQPAVTI